jgi:dipeptidase E
MRLYLSSYKLGNKPKELVRLVGSNSKHVAVIVNASDDTDMAYRTDSLNRQIDDLKNLGFMPEEIDLRKYFNKSEKLKEVLSNFGLVWVKGGNVFILQRAFEQSGFREIIKELLQKDKIVYAGYSAGICVIAPTLKGAELVDDPNIVPEGYKKDFRWEGLSLINYNVAMHYKSDHPESQAIDKEIAYLEKSGLSYKTLRDGEVIVVNGNKETMFTLEMKESEISLK